MLNFVYCFDENYNLQALTSINSLLIKTSKKINLYIIHENPETFSADLISMEKVENFQIFQIFIDDVEFPNLSGTHVSKATYYRFYLSKFLPKDLEYIVYIDADILCLNDPIKLIEKHISDLEKSNKHLVARTEVLKSEKNLTVNPFLNLDLKNQKYFNAGLMIIDFKYWVNQNIEEKLFEIMNTYYQDIVFWDQDVLNKYFDGDYIELNDLCNYEFGVFDSDRYDENFIIQNVIFLHYTGKGKPWDTNFVYFDSSDIYQRYFRMLNLGKYLLSHSSSIRGSKKNYIYKILKFEFLKLKHPFSYLLLSVKAISKIQIKFFNKKIIFGEQEVKRKKPINYDEKDKYLFSHEFKKDLPESYIRILKNPIVINNSIFDLRKFRIYTKDTFYGSHTYSKKIKDTLKNIIRSKKGVIKIQNGIWILDTKSENFGHWMIDALCRYELVPRDFMSYEILLPKRFEINWIIEMLDFLDYKYKIIEENKKYKIENLILTSRAHPSGNYNLEIVNKIRDRFLEGVELYPKKHRVWAYREHVSRTVKNFEEIEEILKKYNFEIIKTDELSLKQKIKILGNTDIISGTHGSGLINLFFMTSGSKIFEVRDFKDTLKNAVFSLASALDIDYFYMERENNLTSDGSIDPKMFEDRLLECLNA